MRDQQEVHAIELPIQCTVSFASSTAI